MAFEITDEFLEVGTDHLVAEEHGFDWEVLLWSVYILGVIAFGFRFMRHLTQIWSRIRRNPKFKENFVTKVLLRQSLPPHTFFNYIFLNQQQFEEKNIPQEVLVHEETHAKQRHSLDILFIELAQVIFWFNPIIYLFKSSIKLNHEFLADRAVIDKNNDHSHYQNTILSYLSHDSFNTHQSTGIANALNYSSIKKRFTVMKTHTSKKKIWFKSIILLPVLALLLFSFSTTIQQDKATPKQVAEYNKLAKKYNEQPKNNRIIKLKDINRLEYLYKLMTPAQKKSAQPFPDCPPPPPAPKQVRKVHKQQSKNLLPPPPPPIPADATEEQIQEAAQAVIAESGASPAVVAAAISSVVANSQNVGNVTAVAALTSVANSTNGSNVSSSGSSSSGGGNPDNGGDNGGNNGGGTVNEQPANIQSEDDAELGANAAVESARQAILLEDVPTGGFPGGVTIAEQSQPSWCFDKWRFSVQNDSFRSHIYSLSTTFY